MRQMFAYAAIAFLFSSVCQAQDKKTDGSAPGAVVDGLRLSAVVATNAFAAMQPIEVHLDLTNVSEEVKIIGISGPMGLLEISVRDENRKEIPLTRFGKSWAEDYRPHARIKPTRMAPGKVYSETIVLNRFFDMTMDGTYLVTFTRSLDPYPPSDKSPRAVSNPLEIRVGQRK